MSTKFKSQLLIRALTVILALALSVMAVPGLGREDTPELPAPDGSSDTPEMIVSLINNGQTANQSSKLKLSSLRGRVTMIDMFWSECQHCREHAPHMVALHNEFKGRGFTVLGLATDKPDKISDVRAFMRNAKINYPVGFITTEIIAYYADSHNHGVPQLVLFGPDGKMAKRWIGWTDEISKEVRTTIQEQLGKISVVKPGSKTNGRVNGKRINRA